MTKSFVLMIGLALLGVAGCGSGGTAEGTASPPISSSRTPPPSSMAVPSSTVPELTGDEGASLLLIARQTLRDLFAGKEPPRYRVRSEALRREGIGAFVTLETVEGRLRGCIGRFDSPYPLHGTVQAMAVAAARHDRRFAPVTKEELPRLRIRVSVLSAPRPLPTPPRGLVTGRHGIMVRRGMRRGCYLPEVAGQMGWSAEEFLEHCTVEKAGLEAGAWRRSDTEVLVFTSQVFEERGRNR